MSIDYFDQERLVNSLRNPDCYPHTAKAVRLMETHISWVLLAGHYAYKLKKSVNLGFLDFTDLEARRFYCEEEIRLNRRFAPQLYLEVIAIGGSPEQPKLGAQPAIEYAVKMRRFVSAKQMDRLMARGLVTPAHIDSLAATLATFHADLPPAEQGSEFGSLEAIHAPAVQNFDQLSPLLNAGDAETLTRLRQASEDEYAACTPLLRQRRQDGWIRECHGDLHLGNIALIRDKPTPFDGIEFNASFRWIDVMNEVAFLVMDLLHHNRPDLAFRFLNGYLQVTGDYQGTGVLRFYLAYRAMVRAKVAAIRAHQPDTKPHEIRDALFECRGHLELAAACLARRRPFLLITYGLPGCGKTTVAQAVLERLQAIRLRSDVERKRLFGLAALDSSRSNIGGGIYSAEATRKTYGRLHDLARSLLADGFPVIVDAAFLKRAEREQFYQLAHEMAVPFGIVSVKVEESILRQRIMQRLDRASDASEADLAVLKALQVAHEPLQAPELARSVEFVNDGDIARIAARTSFWRALEEMVAS